MERFVRLASLYGGSLDPHSCFLLERSLKTLFVRLRQQNATSTALARLLASRSDVVAQVNHPVLEDNPEHARGQKYFSGYAGIFSFKLKVPASSTEQAVAAKFLKALRIPVVAPSLGGPETLAIQPSLTSHVEMPIEERQKRGITDSLIRISTGLENTDDLVNDFAQALDAISG